MLATTLNKIRQYGPCQPGWDKLLKSLGKTKADDEPIALKSILRINGLDYALWVLQAFDGYDKAKRLLACNYADSVLPLYEAEYPGDTRPRLGIETSRRFAWGRATEKELKAACDAVRATRRIIWSASFAEWAARAAANAAAAASITSDVSQGTQSASKSVSKAAWYAALAAVSEGARAARAASVATSDAASAAREAIRAAQAAEFIKFCRLEGEYGEVSKGATYE